VTSAVFNRSALWDMMRRLVVEFLPPQCPG
jgi:hypothetical protein